MKSLDDEFQCEVLRLTYDVARRHGEAFFAHGDCCDMGGCLAVFKRIDPNVTYIATFSGDEPDTHYRRHRSGEWLARGPGEATFMR